MNKLHANIFTPSGHSSVELKFDTKIISIDPIEHNPSLPFLIPGFIDLHVHGGGGFDFMQPIPEIKNILKTHVQTGTTSLLATTMTAPHEELKKTFLNLKKILAGVELKGSKILGVHLEGPFISQEKLGAQPDHTREATLQEIKDLHAIVPIKVLTLAPEAFNHLQIISELNKMGIVVQIGHSNGTYEQGVQALQQGARSFTHLYNAMSGLHHRNPGMVGAALAHAEYAELIPDLEHVHPGAIKAAIRAIPRLYFVTDATSATGMPDGDYKLGSHTVHKCLGGVRLKDGTLAGSALTMIQAFKNMISIGLSPYECSQRLSAIPAQLLKLDHSGELKTGYHADLLLLNHDYEILEVFIEGVKI